MEKQHKTKKVVKLEQIQKDTTKNVLNKIKQVNNKVNKDSQYRSQNCNKVRHLSKAHSQIKES